MACDRSGKMRVGAVIVEGVLHSKWTFETNTSLVYLVHLVCLVDLVSFVQSNTRARPNRPDRPNRHNRPNEQNGLASFFSILLRSAPIGCTL